MDDAASRPKIGVISDCALQRHVLHKALSSYGLSPVLSCEPGRLSQQDDERLNGIQCWVLALQDESYESEALDRLIDQADHVPVLFGLDNAPSKHDEKYISWERRLLSKLEEYLGPVDILESEDSIRALDSPSIQSPSLSPATNIKNKPEKAIRNHDSIHPADDIWVLAASLGGPAAVKEFLDEIPADIKAGFLYAQHVDAHFSNVLTQVLGRHSMLELKAVSDQDTINDGEVLVVPVDHEISFTDSGINIEPGEWEGPYGPSIDHLLRNLFAHYGKRCHVIVFSGMGNDGSLMAPTLAKSGCAVWTQSPESCANGSMPQSLIDLDCSSLTGSPKALAHALITKVGCHESNDKESISPVIDRGL